MLDQSKTTPPTPEPRKGKAINKEYEDRAKELVRCAMRDQGVSVAELAQRLNNMGVEISSGGMANKISRGGFSAAFLLQCLDALGCGPDLARAPNR